MHSDCGGDYSSTADDLLRWTAHCAFGTILRFHGADHRKQRLSRSHCPPNPRCVLPTLPAVLAGPWKFGEESEGVIRSYINARYKLLPSLIAAGQHATCAHFPLAQSCDGLSI